MVTNNAVVLAILFVILRVDLVGDAIGASRVTLLR
jgi:hypothetical protein